MKKIASITAAAALIAAPLALAAPAQAGTDKVTICHATSAANGKYNLIEVDKNATAGGHADHQNAADIIPAYSWITDRTRNYFAGQNLDKLDILANDCKAPAEQLPAKPNAPVYVPASCARPNLPYGEVVIPKDLGEGVAGASTAFSPDSPTWSVTYALAAPTDDKVYTWPAGVTGNYSGAIVPITADPFFITDAKTGEGHCELPETGAKDLLLPALGGVIVLGLGGAALVASRRRKA